MGTGGVLEGTGAEGGRRGSSPPPPPCPWAGAVPASRPLRAGANAGATRRPPPPQGPGGREQRWPRPSARPPRAFGCCFWSFTRAAQAKGGGGLTGKWAVFTQLMSV